MLYDMTRLRHAGLLGLLGLVVAACGAGTAKPAPAAAVSTAATTAPAAAQTVAATVKPARLAPIAVGVHSASGYGQLLVDRKGRTLYLFTADRAGRSACYGACAVAWPPLIVRSLPRGASGIRSDRLSVIQRTGGALQLAYYGHPLYYYVGDRQPGQINCQDAEEYGGHWWLVKPTGQLNRSSP